jgi:hypothetical protein
MAASRTEGTQKWVLLFFLSLFIFDLVWLGSSHSPREGGVKGKIGGGSGKNAPPSVKKIPPAMNKKNPPEEIKNFPLPR